MSEYIEYMMEKVGLEYNTKCKLGTRSACIDKRPTFTPAKQLELIKLIATNSESYKSSSFYMNKIRKFNKWYLSCKVGCYDNEVSNKEFAEAVANLIVVMIRDEVLDKAAVKRILEDD